MRGGERIPALGDQRVLRPRTHTVLALLWSFSLFACAPSSLVRTDGTAQWLRYRPRIGVGGWIIPPQSKVRLLDSTDGWVAVQWGEHSGWISEDRFELGSDEIRRRFAEMGDLRSEAPAVDRALPELTNEERFWISPEPGPGSRLLPEILEYVAPTLDVNVGDSWFVHVDVHVGATGRVEEMRIERSEAPSIDEASLHAAMRCRFSPGSQDGVPMGMWVRLAFGSQMKR